MLRVASPSSPTGSAVPTTPAAVATAARRCQALSRAHRLATWVGNGKPVTPRQVLRPRDVPGAASVLNISVPARINTAVNVSALHRPWCVALGVGFLQIVDGRAVTGPALGPWLDADNGTDNGTVGELWLTGLAAAMVADSRHEDEAGTGATAFSRILLTVLTTSPALTVAELWERAREALISEVSHAADPFFTTYLYRDDDHFSTVSDVLVEFGAVTRHGARLEITPLGRWAAQEMQSRLPKPISADLPADELLARVADKVADHSEDDAWHAARPWLIDRAALPTARELLTAAATATPAQRITAVEIVHTLDDSGQAAWREVAALPNLAAHARLAHRDWNRPQTRSREDSVWLAVEYAAAALATSGPDEALSCIDDWLPGQDFGSRMQEVHRGHHPDTATLIEALTAFIGSGTTPTSSQVYQLKIGLKRSSSPIWRRVLVPATVRLGLLHQVIQIVMDWDGDHLHAFTVRDKRYGDPFLNLDLYDEERLRLSGAFTPATKTITYLYDFGASWYHDITREKVLDLEADVTYPVCVTGRGDFPIEYWNEEDEDQKSVPFDKDTINGRLAELARQANPA